MPALAATQGNEASVDSKSFAIELPIVHVLPDKYFSVTLTKKPTPANTWAIAQVSPAAKVKAEYLTGSYDGTLLGINCLQYDNKRYSVVLKKAGSNSDPQFELQSLKPNEQCIVLRPADTTAQHTTICEDEQIQYTLSDLGVPLLQSYPEAKTTIFLDFDGGKFNQDPVAPYDRDGVPLPLNSTEQTDIVCFWKRVADAFAIFNINVTTSEVAREQSLAWAWLAVGDRSGTFYLASGLGYENTFGTLRDAAWGIVAPPLAYLQNVKNHVAAHEIGHMFGLHHQGTYYVNHLYAPVITNNKLEKIAIMSGIEGDIAAWRFGQHEGPNGSVERQDDVAIIRKKIAAALGAGDGYRPDDFSNDLSGSITHFTNPTYGVIERPGDKDLLLVTHTGGTFTIHVKPRGSSSVDLVLVLLNKNNLFPVHRTNANQRGAETLETNFLPAGEYLLEISSSATTTPYDEQGLNLLGAYTVSAHSSAFTRLSEIQFPDPAMAHCVNEIASAFGWLYTEEVKMLRCENERITSASGIEHLKILESVNLKQNQLQELIFGHHPLLLTVNATDNLLHSVNTTRLPNLKELHLGINNLNTIDTSFNPKLSVLHLSFNFLESINLSQNPELTWFGIGANELKEIDLTNNTKLTWAFLARNRLKKITLPKSFPAPLILHLGANLLTEERLLQLKSTPDVVLDMNNDFTK